MPLSIELFWSFRSPYCYLALDRLLALKRDHGVEIWVRHVWPGAMRRQGYFGHLDGNYPAYQKHDAERMAAYLGIPFQRPRPDPLALDLDSLEPKGEQPHIRRLTRLGVAAAEAGNGIEFLDHVMRLLWDGGTDNWDRGDHLARAVAASGLDLPTLDAAVAGETARLDSIIGANGAALSAAGHWGVPCMVFDGEAFFGQDRINVLKWRMGLA